MVFKVVTTENLAYYHAKNMLIHNSKVDKVEGMGLSTNDYTTADKVKLEAIAEGAQVNVIESVKVNGTPLEIAGKSVNVDLSAYAKLTDITNVYKYQGTVATVGELPSAGQTAGDVYNVEADGSNWAWDGAKWDNLAGTVDLTGYYTKSEIDAQVNTINSAIASKPDASNVYTKDEVYSKTEMDTQMTEVKTSVEELEAEVALKLNADMIVTTTDAEIDALFA